MFEVHNLQKIFRTKYMGTVIIYSHTKFHAPWSSSSMVIVIKLEVRRNFRLDAMLLFYAKYLWILLDQTTWYHIPEGTAVRMSTHNSENLYKTNEKCTLIMRVLLSSVRLKIYLIRNKYTTT
jgi:hypothetical protein